MQYQETMKLQSRFTVGRILTKIHKLPRHVSSWVEENFEFLWDLFYDLQENLPPHIMDRADFGAFCACMARMSSIDSPLCPNGLAGSRFIVYDCFNEKKIKKADIELQTLMS
jgi:hypothetical protein